MPNTKRKQTCQRKKRSKNSYGKGDGTADKLLLGDYRKKKKNDKVINKYQFVNGQ